MEPTPPVGPELPGTSAGVALAVFIPAYQAARTLAAVVDRIPPAVRESMTELLIQDDASTDDTLRVATALAARDPRITVVRNAVNLGYGGTKKKAYRRLLERGVDVIVMVHGDGQHPPELIPSMIAPLLAGRADIVLGSRMLGDARRGGMPLYKYWGNRALTRLMNLALRLRLTDPHTGYRAYTAAALRQLHCESCPDGHAISAHLIFRAAEAKLRIAEVPVPTIYTAESRQCTPRTSVRYGLDVIRLVAARAYASLASRRGSGRPSRDFVRTTDR